MQRTLKKSLDLVCRWHVGAWVILCEAPIVVHTKVVEALHTTTVCSYTVSTTHGHSKQSSDKATKALLRNFSHMHVRLLHHNQADTLGNEVLAILAIRANG